MDDVRWEYYVTKEEGLDDLLETLNNLGDDGWELTQVLKDTEMSLLYTMIFKRKVK